MQTKTMVRASVISAVALVTFLTTPGAPPLSAQVNGGIPANGACFYQDAGYRGAYFCLRAGENLSSMPVGANDEISSIRVVGQAEVIVYRDEGFSGASVRLTDSVLNLADAGWNDAISAIQVRGIGFGNGGRTGGGQFGSGQQTPRQGACFYQDAGFQGDRFCLAVGVQDASMPLTFNDAVSSIEVFGGATITIFEHEDFGGQAIQISNSVTSLADSRSPNGFRWNDAISSVRVEGNVSQGARGFGRGGGGQVQEDRTVPRQGVCFYQDAGFAGDRYCLARGQSAPAMPLSFNDAVSSVQVFGGATVMIFEHENYGGQSIQISTSVPNLVNARAPNGFRWNDVISSVRVY
jgi:hypothetical protein